MRKVMIIGLLLLMLLSGAAIAQETAEPVGIDAVCGEAALTITALDSLPEDEQTQALDQLLRQFVTLPSGNEAPLSSNPAGQKPPAPGAVVYLDIPGQQYYRGIGVSDVESCTPMDPAMPFPIGSNTKMFTAAVIWQLHEEGQLSVDDLVSQYLPEEIALFEGAEPITIKMLLSHTNGLPDYLNSPAPTSIGSLDLADPEGISIAYTPRELVENAALDSNGTLLFEPGAEGQWSYSNTGYIMLGMIIEQVTGQSYIDAVTERIIDRLGLENTVLVDGIISDEVGIATQYLKSPWDFITDDWDFSQAWSAGNGVSTPEDMATFLRAYYSGNLFQKEETLAALLERATAPGNGEQTENHYYMQGGYYKSGFYGHGGQTLGTESDVGYNPEYDVVIVTWGNSSEAYTGQGVYHAGSLVGLTPSYDAFLSELTAASTPTLVDLIGLEFSLVSLTIDDETAMMEDGGTYSLTVDSEDQMTIVADCNTVMAAFTTGDANSIDIELGASTLVACPEGSLSDDMLMILDTATAVLIVDAGEQLILIIQAGETTSVGFTAQKP